ncbi:nitrile hydratase subunit beta [Mesorhizobium sp. CO1-1-8]|uniref:nitrile hydratase subunit beta n=1 Tax=Mesorhizobium sp. CO1-1-8 TaxID=2876631 RepID=UPI001CD130E6|nr:nitrile hydratase subunit beta [Mesorhizobium sp. CO1-1-8]MBZ9772391.1 nitrile hydratase subunit beta [Mesorhizobium sp. CO1-1-8]
MDGIADMGGKQGYGRLPEQRDNLPFHHDWEPLAYIVAILAAEKGWWTFDSGRHAIERIPPKDYMRGSYYERTLVGLAALYVEHGLVSHEELEERAGGRGSFPLSTPIGVGNASRPHRPDFKVGDKVIVTGVSPTGHCRAPKYCHGKRGEIVGIAPKAHFPGEIAHKIEAAHEHTYHVRFEGSELWSEVEDGSSVVVDLFASYLNPLN